MRIYLKDHSSVGVNGINFAIVQANPLLLEYLRDLCGRPVDKKLVEGYLSSHTLPRFSSLTSSALLNNYALLNNQRTL